MIELMTSTLALATGDPDAPWIPEKYRALILVLSIPGLYCLMLLLGRWLKRSHGVRLGWSYHLFALCLAIYFPAKLFDERLVLPIWGTPITFRHEIGALMGLLGALFLLALVDRYVWDLYF